MNWQQGATDKQTGLAGILITLVQRQKRHSGKTWGGKNHQNAFFYISSKLPLNFISPLQHLHFIPSAPWKEEDAALDKCILIPQGLRLIHCAA